MGTYNKSWATMSFVGKNMMTLSITGYGSLIFTCICIYIYIWMIWFCYVRVSSGLLDSLVILDYRHILVFYYHESYFNKHA